MKRSGRAALALVFAVIFALVCSGAMAADDAAAGAAKMAKELAKKHKDAVVSVKLTLEVSMNIRGQEQKQEQTREVPGVVVDPSGLVVMPLSLASPESAMRGIQMKTSVIDAKLVQTDGKEVVGKVVMRDKDLDLAFFKPDEKKEGLPFIALDKDIAAAPEVLDDVVVITRLGRDLDRELFVGVASVGAVIKKPRTMFIARDVNLGSPAFSADGKLIGVVILYKNQGVVLPAADVAEVAAQAKNAGGDEKKPEDEKKEPEKKEPEKKEEAK